MPTSRKWKPGRGRLGVFSPLIGTWRAEAASPMGPVVCTRTFAPVLGGSHVQLTAVWEIGPKLYEEMAMFGAGPDGGIVYSSFTSDGKSATGQRADVTDVHPEAIGFEAAMPAGRARMIYWPDDEGGFHWVVESRNRKGWHRFTEHHYVRVR